MSQAEALMASMSDEIPVHTHPVPDTDTYFIIDPITRKIENTNPKKSVIMQYDHNSERFTFELPRYIDGHDMLECTSITVNVDNIEVIESDGVEEVEPRVNPDAPDMTDLRVHPSDPEKVISSWLITRNSTQLAGILSFHIEYKCVDSNGNVVYEWSTDNYDEIEVRPRKKNGEAAVIEHTDLLEQWRIRIFRGGDSVMSSIAAEGEAQIAAVKAESETQQEAVELKGAQTLDTIPEEYSKVDAMAEEAVRSKGDAIVCEAVGESIVLKNSSNDHIRGLKLKGKSKQLATNGYQLFDASVLATATHGGTTVTNNRDGSFTVSGSGNLSADFVAQKDYTHEETLKLLKTGTLNAVVKQTHPYWYVQIRNKSTVYFALTHSKLSQTITDEMLTDPDMFMRVGFYADSGSTIAAGTIKPMLYMDGDGTWEPYTGGKPSPNPEYPQEIVSIETPSIAVHSKNLIPFPYPMFANSNTDEVDVTVMDDGGVLINGTPTVDTFINLCKYDFGPNHISPSTASGFIVNKHSSSIWVSYDGKNKITFIMVKSGTVCNNEVVYPQLEAGTVATEYEKDSGRQSFGIDRTLSGIPVSSGGNYTDENGQQWICDEIDLERGVYVQRMEQYVYDGSEDENWKNGYSSNGRNNRFELILMGVPVEHEVCESNNAAFVAKNAYCSHFDYQRTSTRPDVNNFRISKSVTAVQDWWYMLFAPDTTIVPLEDLDAWKTYLAENPMTVMIPLNTPIETPLTAEEITAFKALRTNYPNTTILNDAGAWMSVKYNVDTKSYVDKPKALRLTDTSTGVVYELKIVDGSLTVVPV